MEMPMNPSSAGASDAPSASTSKPTKKLVDDDGSVDDSDTDKPSRRSGRRKIKIEYIEDKNRRHITFSKRKAGIMKKAYELSTLTGTQVLLLVVSETGLVYTFTTVKLQPIVTKPEGKNLIQACLNAPDPVSAESSSSPVPENVYGNSSPTVEADKSKAVYEDKKAEFSPAQPQPQHHHQPASGSPAAASYQPYVQGSWSNNHPSYMAAAAAAAVAAPYQPQQQPASQPPSQHYGNPLPSYYGNHPHHQQQQPYLPQQHPGYWPGSSAPPPSRSHHSMARHDHPGAPAESKVDDSKPGAAN